jgi:hypothetical protein
LGSCSDEREEGRVSCTVHIRAANGQILRFAQNDNRDKPIFETGSKGFDTVDLKEAKALLEELTQHAYKESGKK